MPSTILFLCTGNYYRSRFAEELFNSLATKSKLDWVALAVEIGIYNVGPMSEHSRAELVARGIPLNEPVRFPLQCSEADLLSATRVIALKEAEHRSYLTKRYPDWPDRVEYWHVHDLDQASPQVALTEIAAKVDAIIEQLEQVNRSKA